MIKFDQFHSKSKTARTLSNFCPILYINLTKVTKNLSLIFFYILKLNYFVQVYIEI